MKKVMFALGAVGLSLAACAGVDDVLLMFSTKGPDTYRDGTAVLAKECYALCYVTDAAKFAIKADGTAAAGGEVLLTAPVATAREDGAGMHCPNLVYVIPAAKADTLKGGRYAVYLLDTRVPDASAPTGYAVAGLAADGAAAVVNGAGAVATGGTMATGAGLTVYNGAIVEGGSVSELSVIDRPTITAINVAGADVQLTVSGLSPAADYKVYTGAGPAGVSTLVPATQSGNTFTVRKDAGQFFKVVGTRTVQ